MYGSVLGSSTTAAAIAVLPQTGGNKLAIALTLITLTIGVVITVVTLSKILAAKFFAQNSFVFDNKKLP